MIGLTSFKTKSWHEKFLKLSIRSSPTSKSEHSSFPMLNIYMKSDLFKTDTWVKPEF